MNRKAAKKKMVSTQSRDEHELLQQENFTWLAEFRDTLSPYWASRMEYRPPTKG